jgi:Na+/glutamate symporter
MKKVIVAQVRVVVVVVVVVVMNSLWTAYDRLVCPNGHPGRGETAWVIGTTATKRWRKAVDIY